MSRGQEQSPAEGELRRRARRGLAVYLSLTFAISFGIEAWIISLGGKIEFHMPQVFLLMWTPTFTSIVTRLVLREGFGDISLRLGGKQGVKGLCVAVAFPVAVGTFAYCAAWISGLTVFAPPNPELLGLPTAPGPVLFCALLALTATLGVPLSALSAAGEEFGWRGYMLTRLIDAGVPRPLLVSGVIWAAWHMPIIFSGQYASSDTPALSAALFLLDVIAIAYVAGQLRLASGSVWPAVMIHSAWNSIIQGAFDASTQRPGFWVGESGLFTALVALGFAALYVRRRFTPLRSPGEPMGESTSGLAL
ncbi:MAG: CPBP family intramembrane metalloprotease [Deltaproteobacteria bacterium]|nr:CPBP family intramembrane metalloprotease [Deltaproteobacteria bacterium]